MSTINITIAICTWNRSEQLRATLTSLQKMGVRPDVHWELLVVNNNCTDNTDEVIANFADTLPIRSLLETRQGLSNARNRAVDEARGDYILWTDDDVIVEPGWLAAYADAFGAWPKVAVFGGPIKPVFDGKPPSWVRSVVRDNRLSGVYGRRDLGDEPIPLSIDGGQLPFGANFAIRMQEQRHLPYNPRLGVCGNGNVRGEELDVVKRILRSGGEGRWVPNAPVCHCIPKNRQTVTYVRKYFMGLGRTRVRLDPATDAPSLLGAPRWLWRSAIASQLRYCKKRIVAPPKVWCNELRRASVMWGKLLEYRAIRRGPQRLDRAQRSRAK